MLSLESAPGVGSDRMVLVLSLFISARRRVQAASGHLLLAAAPRPIPNPLLNPDRGKANRWTLRYLSLFRFCRHRQADNKRELAFPSGIVKPVNGDSADRRRFFRRQQSLAGTLACAVRPIAEQPRRELLTGGRELCDRRRYVVRRYVVEVPKVDQRVVA